MSILIFFLFSINSSNPFAWWIWFSVASPCFNNKFAEPVVELVLCCSQRMDLAFRWVGRDARTAFAYDCSSISMFLTTSLYI